VVIVPQSLGGPSRVQGGLLRGPKCNRLSPRFSEARNNISKIIVRAGIRRIKLKFQNQLKTNLGKIANSSG